MTASSFPKIGGILLAAGGSSRLGQPKQLLQFQGKSLLRRAAETLAGSKCSNIVVVLGAEITGSTGELTGLPVNIRINKDWASGMSSSIKAGLNALLAFAPDTDAVVIALCDQPNISPTDIDRLIDVFDQTHPGIVAAEYSGTVGVPALFPRSLFEDLRNLTGDKGARNMLRRQENLTAIKLDAATIDIDTLADYESLNQ